MNMVEEDGKIWFALLNRNGICEVDRRSWQARICKNFEGEPLNGSFLYSHVEKIEKKLVFAPGMAKRIAVYDLEYGTITYIPLKPLEEQPKESQDEIKFWNTFRYRSCVYLFGYSYPAIIKINMRTMKVQYITDWLEEIEESIDVGDNNGYFADGIVISGDLAVIPVGCMRAVLELNLKTGHVKLRKLKVSMNGVGGISSINGEDVWLVGRGGKANRVSCWNQKTDYIKEFMLADVDENLADPFYAPICTKDQVFLMPMSGPCIYEIKIDTGEVNKSDILKRQFRDNRVPLPWWKTMAPKLNGDRMFFLTCDDTRWQEYNVITGEVKSYFIHFENNLREIESYFEAVYRELIKKEEIMLETNMPLRYFIDKNSQRGVSDLYKKDDKCLVGENIYQMIDLERR